MNSRRKALGRAAEELAAEFLMSRGYEILSRNLVLPAGEVDLLVQDGDSIVVVEVKSQEAATLADPIFKIDQAKQRKLKLLAQILVARYPDRPLRIDAVTVIWNQLPEPTISHLPNILAF